MCRVLIICTDRFFAKKAKETLVIGDDIQIFQAPLCKGSSAEGGEGLFLQHSNRCAVSEPLSARPASVLRTLANPSLTREGLLKSIAALPHRFSSIFSLISSLRVAVCSAAKMREKIL